MAHWIFWWQMTAWTRGRDRNHALGDRRRGLRGDWLRGVSGAAGTLHENGDAPSSREKIAGRRGIEAASVTGWLAA
jgi:hypothetical protein